MINAYTTRWTFREYILPISSNIWWPSVGHWILLVCAMYCRIMQANVISFRSKTKTITNVLFSPGHMPLNTEITSIDRMKLKRHFNINWLCKRLQKHMSSHNVCCNYSVNSHLSIRGDIYWNFFFISRIKEKLFNILYMKRKSADYRCNQSRRMPNIYIALLCSFE